MNKKDRARYLRNLRTILIIAGLIIGFYVLQSTLFRALTFGGIGPNLMIVLTCSLGLMFGDVRGLFIGFFCGLLMDIFGSGVIGFYSLVYAFIGYLAGKFEKIVFPDNLRIPLLTVLTGDFVYGFLCYVFQFLIRGRLFIGYFIVHFLLPEMLYTFLTAVFLYPMILLLYRKFMRPIPESEENYARKKTQT
ncbi:MAG: rod shape-determining protein MreD [Lachnospiraceae bacterium]|jgi:rod shape-determining protein MreD|nr:rod shape-determining protein MreD [Lachnospiraceae bacterium]MDY2945214.1 rod shape-determining protein MreD [Lachnospiraceae bacterium]MDY6342246.1 rod shape-determining protein MreD [Lachnospiraceae bacterium]